jgi:hypothetical protein
MLLTTHWNCRIRKVTKQPTGIAKFENVPKQSTAIEEF